MNTLKAEKRDGKTKAKELRREGWITGSVYGRDLEGAISVQMNVLEAEAMLREHKQGDEITIQLDGKKRKVIIKEIQHDFLKHQFLEIDFQTVPKK